MPHIADIKQGLILNPYYDWEADPEDNPYANTGIDDPRNNTDLYVNSSWTDPDFNPITSSLLRAKATTFSPLTPGTTSVQSAPGRVVQPGRGTSKFVIPRPKPKSRTRFGLEGSVGGIMQSGKLVGVGI